MNSSLEKLNDQQSDALKEFKSSIADILPPDFTDVFLLKWLQAHNYNVKKTEALFRGARRSRVVYDMDTIVEKFVRPEVIQKYEFSSFLGFAKDGTPIRYTRFGQGDLIGFLMSLTGYEIGLYCTYLFECDFAALRKHNRETGKEASEITYISDLEHFSLDQLMHKNAIETGLDLVQMMQDFYPLMWGNILLVNAPSYFHIAFNMFKPIMRMDMLQKIQVVDKGSTPSLLLKYIDEDVLPAFLGGKKTDSTGDPKCTEFVKYGGTVPEELYLRNKVPLNPTDDGVTSLWVSARSVFNYSVVVRQEHSKIHVQFRTENGSIGFKMQFRELGDDAEKIELPPCDEYLDENDPKCNVKFVSPFMRQQAHTTPVDQLVNAPWPGIYIFRFDNTNGWFTSRRIIFRIRVVQNTS